MANHVSAKKRSRQNKTRNTVNSQYLSKFRNALNKFKSSVILTEGIIKPKSFETCLLTPVTLDTSGPVLSLSTNLIKP